MSRRIKHSAIWLIPIGIIVASLIFHLLVWYITPSRRIQFDYGTTPFVPGESYYAVGRESR